MMVILCYPRCSTCAKAVKWLEAHGIPFTYRDIQKQNPTAAELRGWLARSGLPLSRFWNTSGMAYRAQGLAQRRPAMDDGEQLALLATDGLLVKRPIVVGQGLVLVGFNAREWAEKLL